MNDTHSDKTDYCNPRRLGLITVNSRSNDIIKEGGSVLYSRPSRGSHYLAHKLLLLIHQAHALDNPILRYIGCTNLAAMRVVFEPKALNSGVRYLESATIADFFVVSAMTTALYMIGLSQNW